MDEPDVMEEQSEELVPLKGLDYGLLNKERERIRKLQTITAKKEERKQQQKMKKKGVTFVSPMGRAVYSALFKQNKTDVREFFKPGRTAFLYNMEDDKASLVPIVLRRSKTEMEEKEIYVMPSADSANLKLITTVISCILDSTEDLTKKVQKREILESMLGVSKPEESESTKPEIRENEEAVESNKRMAEDDIFADVGTDYVCSTTRNKKKRQPKEKQALKEVETEVEDRDLVMMDKKTKRQIEPSSLPDHYVECYPGFHQSYTAAVVDSDDEDLSHMDVRGKGVSRYNFETDEQWSSYKQQMEQLPKAAFQYGVKKTDGRKTQSKLAEKHRREQKLNNQLTKIEKIHKEKGYSHDSAFSSDKNKTDSTPALATPRNKKRIRLDN